MSRGLKPVLLWLLDARAGALAYLRGRDKGKGKGNGKGEYRDSEPKSAQNDDRGGQNDDREGSE